MKKYLNTFAAVAASFAATHVSAAMPASDALSPINQAAATEVGKSTDRILVRTDTGDAYGFVMRRSSETGMLMASHESHASHVSHRSHYSSRY